MEDPIARIGRFSETLNRRKLSLEDIIGFERKPQTTREYVYKYTFRDNSTLYLKAYESLREETYANALKGLPCSAIIDAHDDAYLEEQLDGEPLETAASRIPAKTLGKHLAVAYNCFHNMGLVYGDIIDNHWYYGSEGIKATDFGGVSPIHNTRDKIESELAEMITFLESHFSDDMIRKEILPAFKDVYCSPVLLEAAIRYHEKFRK